MADLPRERWSFSHTDASGAVVEVAEKRRNSDNASTGLYWFTRGGEFLRAADETIRSRDTVGGEYYVLPMHSD